MPEMKRTIKDSIFTLMFRQPEYALQLYQALHPEDTDVTEADCKVVTLENILTVGQYNDLGLQVRDKLLLLVEAQSTFFVNITLRMLMYVAATYREYVEEQKLDLYGSRAVMIPKPELWKHRLNPCTCLGGEFVRRYALRCFKLRYFSTAAL